MNAKERVDEMIALDFIIGNDDRHKGNFGIMRDANNLQWLGIGRIFDNGNSLFFDKTDYDLPLFGIDSLGKSFGDSNRLQLEAIGYPEWYNTAFKNRVPEVVNNWLTYNERLTSERKDKIIGIVKERMSVFENVINRKVNKQTTGI